MKRLAWWCKKWGLSDSVIFDLFLAGCWLSGFANEGLEGVTTSIYKNGSGGSEVREGLPLGLKQAYVELQICSSYVFSKVKHV